MDLRVSSAKTSGPRILVEGRPYSVPTMPVFSEAAAAQMERPPLRPLGLRSCTKHPTMRGRLPWGLGDLTYFQVLMSEVSAQTWRLMLGSPGRGPDPAPQGSQEGPLAHPQKKLTAAPGTGADPTQPEVPRKIPSRAVALWPVETRSVNADV